MTTYSPLAVFRHMLLRATLVTLAPTLLAAGERQKKAEREAKKPHPKMPPKDLDVAKAALPPVTPSSPAGVESLTLALQAFEAHISWVSVSRTWATRRTLWLRRAKKAAAVEDVADLLLTLESAMGWTGMDSAWSRRRDAWLEAVESADTSGAVAPLLEELELSTKWTAVTSAWKGERGAWCRALGALRVASRSE